MPSLFSAVLPVWSWSWSPILLPVPEISKWYPFQRCCNQNPHLSLDLEKSCQRRQPQPGSTAVVFRNVLWVPRAQPAPVGWRTFCQPWSCHLLSALELPFLASPREAASLHKLSVLMIKEGLGGAAAHALPGDKTSPDTRERWAAGETWRTSTFSFRELLFVI